MPTKEPRAKKPPGASKPHAWDAAGFITVSVKFTPDLHQRARTTAGQFRGRQLSALVTAAVAFVLDELDAGRLQASTAGETAQLRIEAAT